MNICTTGKNRILIKLLSFIVIINILCPKISWANEEVYIECLANKSFFKSDKNRDEFQATMICETIEKRASYGKQLKDINLNDIILWNKSNKKEFEGCRFEILQDEIRIHLIGNNITVRYFDPSKANIVIPYSDISKLETKIICPRLNRQIIHRVRALPSSIDASLQEGRKSATGESNPVTLERPITTVPEALPPAAISFQVADFKFGPDGVKILEIQEGIGSAFEGYSKLYGEEMMGHFWRYLSTIRKDGDVSGLKGLYVGGDLEIMMGGKEHMKTRGNEALKETGGIMLIGQMLGRALRDKELGFNQRKPNFNEGDLRTYTGVAILHSTLHSPEELDRIREQNPQLIELDMQGATAFYLGDKLLANTLFTGNLQSARPRWRLFPKDYNPAKLADEIRQTIPSKSGKYVIKAIDSSRGRGFMAVEANQLEEVLTNILIQVRNGEAIKEREKLEAFRLADGEENPYEFWAVDTSNPGILVEELVESRPVQVADKFYDGTMRVVYVMTHDKTNGTQMKILGYYWKLPATAVGEGGLRETVLSRIYGEGEGEEKVNSAKVSQEDQAAVAAQLKNILPELYHRMLSATFESAFHKLLFSENRDEIAYGIYLLRKPDKLAPEVIERLIKIAQLKDRYLDFHLSGLIRGIYEWKEHKDLIPLVAMLAHSDDPEARNIALKTALENKKLSDMTLIALSIANEVADITDLERRAEYIDFLRDQNKITDEQLLSSYEDIFKAGEFESQKFIIRILFERKLILCEESNWLWPYLENEDSQLYTLWVYEYDQNKNKFGVHQTSQLSKIPVVARTNDFLDNLPPEKVVKLLELVTYEQSMKRIDYYIDLVNKSYQKTRDQGLDRLIREANNIKHFGIIFTRFRQTRKAIDAYYNDGIVRDVLSASQQVIGSLDNPKRQGVLLGELMQIPVDQKFFDQVEDMLKTAVRKSGGVRFSLGLIRTEKALTNQPDIVVTRFFGQEVGITKPNGMVERTITREGFRRILENLRDHIATRANVDSGQRLPLVVRESLQISQRVVDGLSGQTSELARKLQSLPEDENLPTNIEKALFEMVEKLAGGDFPLINNYREEGLLQFEHRKQLRGVKEPASIASIFGIDLSWLTRGEKEWHKMFTERKARDISSQLIASLKRYILQRVPSAKTLQSQVAQQIRDFNWAKRRDLNNTAPVNQAPSAEVLSVCTNLVDAIVSTNNNASRRESQSSISSINEYVSKNEKIFRDMLGENKPDVLLRVPVEAIESIGIENIKDFLETFQKAPNAYMELYCISGAGDVSKELYEKFELEKKPLPKDFVKTRVNTITLFATLKGEELAPGSILNRLGEIGLNPTDTILSPIGFQHDPAGLIRSTILGLRLMSISRQKKQIGNIDYEFIQETVSQIREVCEPEEADKFDLTVQDLINIAIGDINGIIKSLRKLIILLPVKPIIEEDLRQIYEYTSHLLTAA